MVVYSCFDYYLGYLYCVNINGVEIIVIRLMIMFYIFIVGVYRLLVVLII